ncbi:hypothetical protein [Actinophytocola sp.]|uniref:hypothetical protein n=1 Tax=Actinophytocola sp. TaxID=1872138 RepID=UPI002ED663C0
MADETTAQFYALSVRQARLWVLSAVSGLVLGALVLWRPEWYSVAIGMIFVGVVQSRFGVVPTQMPWRAATGPLLAGQPWRETPVRVLNTIGTVLYLDNGEYVLVRVLPAAAREVIVRAGRVWLVGPDAKGRFAVRVDGSHTAWPAKRIRPVTGTAALPTHEPIAAMAARVLVERMRPMAGFFPVLAVLYLVMAVFSTTYDGEWWWYPFAAFFVFLTVMFWVSYRQLKRLRPTEPWTRAQASEPSWRVRGNGTATGTVVLDFPDGRRVTAHLDRAPLDLFVNVRQEKALWIAGNGVVGFPHYPSVALARLVATPTPVRPVPSAG